MKFLIITYAPTLKIKNEYKSYAPYTNEMNIWFKYVNEVRIVSPIIYNKELLLGKFNVIPKIFKVPPIKFTTLSSIIRSCFFMPIIFFKLFKAMFWADHIHLRCPGNIGLLACLVQIFFPRKIKTAKYAGNWDPKSKQPLSYRIQKWILKNTFLTKKMTVLVYGKWKNQTKNIKPFFTASFTNKDKIEILERDYSNKLKFIFIGSLVKGKRPLLAIKIVEKLINSGRNVELQIFGDGVLRQELESYVDKNNLKDSVNFKGNQKQEVLKLALINSYFLILASKSEGWPKAVAEAMFYGVIPIVTSISCVPFMVDYGKRGILIEPNLQSAINTISKYLRDIDLNKTSRNAAEWSQEYTLEKFETEIKKLLHV